MSEPTEHTDTETATEDVNSPLKVLELVPDVFLEEHLTNRRAI